MNCPNCKYRFDYHSAINKKDAKPKNGDITICINCGQLHEFVNDKLLAVTNEYAQKVLDKESFAAIKTAQYYILQRFTSKQ